MSMEMYSLMIIQFLLKLIHVWMRGKAAIFPALDYSCFSQTWLFMWIETNTTQRICAQCQLWFF